MYVGGVTIFIFNDLHGKSAQSMYSITIITELVAASA